jgi:3-hydroxybutyryl-CoA dehydrogenase
MTSPSSGTIAVIGNGVIGHGIAEIFAKGGWEVCLIGRSPDSLSKAIDRIRSSLDEFVEAGLLPAPVVPSALSRIRTSTAIERAANVDLAIEALPEDMDLKVDTFAQLDAICRPDTVLATASGHPASSIDARVTRKDRVVAAHFWYPPQLLPLVEVCGSPVTSAETVHWICEVLTAVEKTPVVLDREVPGFLGNRIQFAALREAWSLWASGVASAEAIDSVVKNSIGRRLAVTGPIESADLGGLDTMYHFAQFLFPSLDRSVEPPTAIGALVREGNRGVASGRGIYDWADGSGAALLSSRRRELLRWLKIDRTTAQDHEF